MEGICITLFFLAFLNDRILGIFRGYRYTLDKFEDLKDNTPSVLLLSNVTTSTFKSRKQVTIFLLKYAHELYRR